jgi:hypothetical protein
LLPVRFGIEYNKSFPPKGFRVIVNAYAVLDAAMALLRLVFGLTVVVLGAMTWRQALRGSGVEQRQPIEARNYLLSQCALLLLALNVVSWPLLYALLQSYVAEWSGLMCVYGVTRIGVGSLGPGRFLPGLLVALQTLKPLLVFASGSWFVLYLLNRQTQTGPLVSRLLPVLVLCGILTVVDAGVELTYLFLPKKEVWPEGGCCTGSFLERPDPDTLMSALAAPAARPWLFLIFYASSGLMALALFGLSREGAKPAAGPWLALLLGGAVVSLAAGGPFLIEVVAPGVLHLPYHHCAYDLIPRAPDVLVGVGLLVGGASCVGWACVAGWIGRSRDTAPFLPGTIRGLLFLGFCCYLGSVVLLSLELALA